MMRGALLILALFVALGLTARSPAQDADFSRGDANVDGILDLSDAVAILGFLFLTEPLGCLDAADADDSGDLNVADAIVSLGYVFAGGAPFPTPGPGECGPDPTPDALGCESFPLCPQAPVAAFVATPSSGEAPLEVTFDASASFDADGPIVSYAWDFGDGVMDTGVVVSHTYTTLDTFTAVLTVTDAKGKTGTATVDITTTGFAPPVTIDSTSPTDGETGVAVTRETPGPTAPRRSS